MTMKMKLFWLKMGQRLGRLTNWLFWSLIGSQRYLSSDWLKWPKQINKFENPKSDSDLFAKERQKLEKSENRKNSDCDVIESLKILNKADGQINFFPIIQKILLSSEFQSFDIRKTALPGTICIWPEMSHPYDSSPMSCDRFQVGSCFHNEIMYLMHEKITCHWKLNANPFSKAILCSIEKHLETNFGHSLTDLGNSIILTLKVSFIF